KDEGPARVHGITDQGRKSSKVGPTATEGLAQCPHLIRDLCFKTKVFYGSSSMRSHHTRAVGVIDIEVGLIVLGQPAEFRQWREVSVHTEQTVGHNKGAPRTASLGKKRLEVGGIVVAINTKVGCAETAAVDQAGMAQAIGQDQSALFAQ